MLVYEFDEDGEMRLLLARQDHSSQKGNKRGSTRHRAWNILGATCSGPLRGIRLYDSERCKRCDACMCHRSCRACPRCVM